MMIARWVLQENCAHVTTEWRINNKDTDLWNRSDDIFSRAVEFSEQNRFYAGN